MAKKPLPVLSEPVEETEEGVSQEEGEGSSNVESGNNSTEGGLWLMAKFNTFFNPYTQERFNVGEPKQCLKLDSLIQCQIDAGILIVVDPPVKAKAE